MQIYLFRSPLPRRSKVFFAPTLFLFNNNINILLKSKVKHIAITIDGLKEQHDSLRVLRNGGATFDKIIANLEYIRDNVKTRMLTVSLRSNITIEALSQNPQYND